MLKRLLCAALCLTAPAFADPTAFHVWFPKADRVSIAVDGRAPVPLQLGEGGIWSINLPGVGPGATYTYEVGNGLSDQSYDDPCSLQLTSWRGGKSVVSAAVPHPTPFVESAPGKLVIYELHVDTFTPAGTFASAESKLDYLRDLGVNAVELMPIQENRVRNEPPQYNWGYDPVQLYSIEHFYGDPNAFAHFVDEAHKRGIAVVLDVVFGHVTRPNVMQSAFFRGGNEYGVRPDFSLAGVRRYLVENCTLWMREFGVDALRFDDTTDMRENEGKQDPGGQQLLHEINARVHHDFPDRLTIAEDLHDHAEMVERRGYDFSSQWSETMWHALRDNLRPTDDGARNPAAVRAAFLKRVGPHAFSRVIYTENHDKVGHPDDDGQVRFPRIVDPLHPDSLAARRRSTLAAALVMTAPGIPLMFQGQEMLDDRTFEFFHEIKVDWDMARRREGIVHLYRDLIGCRTNRGGVTAGLSGEGAAALASDHDLVLAFHRYDKGGPGDDTVVVANLSGQRTTSHVAFPRAGRWRVRFNSGSSAYGFAEGDSPDVDAQGAVSVGPYSLVVLSQDR